ncbi:hypothetical protein [Carboxylicivirga sp. N1Y90]|uniref:hypothetical protein n=1 Tax=Carboxylicivirga fragile TaxID=3417571 RepID=UPI003D33D548|nr:hypothetical protein [Marinilabiliaceae bacterium N1Y90]
MIDVVYKEELGIIISECTGVFNLELVIDYIDNLRNTIKTEDHLFILLDSTRAEIKIDPRKELRCLVSKLGEKTKIYRQVYVVFVVDKPYETVLALLFKEMSNSAHRIDIDIFSTRHEAERRLINVRENVIRTNK